MAQLTETICTHGILKCLPRNGTREQQRLRVIVEPLDELREDRATALARLKAAIASAQFLSARLISSTPLSS